MTYAEHTSFLASLDSFPKEAFLPGPGATREECGFFLALAVIHNDLKDIVLGQVLLSEVPVPALSPLTPTRGQYGGLDSHLLRTLGGLMHELLEVIRAHSSVLSGRLFQEAHRKCPKEGKKAWKAICDAADGTVSSDPLSKALFFVRNKVSFHYDVKALLQGYESAFSQPRFGPPMLSRGNSMRESRFYFADAAAQAYLFEKTGADGTAPLFAWSTDHSGHVNHALHWLVLKFIETRGFTFREYCERT